MNLLTLWLAAIFFAMYAYDNPKENTTHISQVKAKKNKRCLASTHGFVFLPSFRQHTSSGSQNNLNKRFLTNPFSKAIAFV